MKITTLIVDDEPHARRYIHDLLDNDEEVHILGECKNGREVLEFVKNKKPDVIFMDIQMPGMTGMQVASKLKSLNSVIVFTTAYDQYALKAFEVEALDYLLKPFDEKRFYEVLERVKEIIEKDQQALLSSKLLNVYDKFKQAQSPHVHELIIKEKGLERAIAIEDIAYLEASSVYAIIYTKTEPILYRTTLNLLEQQLPANFLRVHRSFIINTNHIQNSNYLNNNTFSFTMSNGKTVISSRSFKEIVKRKVSSPH